MGKKSFRNRSAAPSSTAGGSTRLPTTERILAKWKAQAQFIRFVDGDTGNCAISNLQRVRLSDAMEHIDEWVVDWDMDLTAEEIATVRSVQWRAGLTFS